jgi:hypothetical protein
VSCEYGPVLLFPAVSILFRILENKIAGASSGHGRTADPRRQILPCPGTEVIRASRCFHYLSDAQQYGCARDLAVAMRAACACWFPAVGFCRAHLPAHGLYWLPWPRVGIFGMCLLHGLQKNVQYVQ